MRSYKRSMRRKEERLEQDSAQALVVIKQMDLLRKAVNDLFKLKVDKRIKRKKAA